VCPHLPQKIQCQMTGLFLINKWSLQIYGLYSSRILFLWTLELLDALDNHLTDQNQQHYSKNRVGVNHHFIQLKSNKMSSWDNLWAILQYLANKITCNIFLTLAHLSILSCSSMWFFHARELSAAMSPQMTEWIML